MEASSFRPSPPAYKPEKGNEVKAAERWRGDAETIRRSPSSFCLLGADGGKQRQDSGEPERRPEEGKGKEVVGVKEKQVTGRPGGAVRWC